jgi:phosphatidylinositol alpha-1,6-mannosyltransferase
MTLKKILFLNLTAFSTTGGIEKFNRAFLKALSEIQKEGLIAADAYSAYDDKADSKYFDQDKYKGFKGNKFCFALHILRNAFRYNTIVLSHIHLSSVVLIVKALFPSKKIILITHGIEVWRKLSSVQKKILQKADKILAVSAFTRQKLVEVHGIDAGKITVFHNTLDPYFALPEQFEKPRYLMDRYSLSPRDSILFTLTRLSYTEKHKGYDKVIQILPRLKVPFPNVKYVLSGKLDEKERKRLADLKESNQLKNELLLTGFVKDEEITDHYLLADVFILPSQKEGFGIVFIEAMACGVPVIGGNKDGTSDALQQGELGYLIDPENETEILSALNTVLSEKDKAAKNAIKKKLQQKVYQTFGFETYKQNLKKVLA